MLKNLLILWLLLAGILAGQPGFTQPALPAARTSSSNISMVRSWEARRPFTLASDISSSARTAQEVRTSTLYYDGLGKLIQTVVKQGSPAGNDMVTPENYDAFGREQYRYLSFASNTRANGADITNDGKFKLDAYQQQAAFYNDPNGILKGQNENFFFGQLNFEASPLNRTTESFAPGNSWSGTAWNGSSPNTNVASHHSMQTQYLNNTAADNVQMWDISMPQGSIPTNFGVYPAGKLYKTINIDEAGHQVVEYKDTEGHVILKKVQSDTNPGVDHTGWLCTYYIYDKLSNLRFVIQPKAIQLLLNRFDGRALLSL